jgi:hypothetical protein
MDSNTARMIVLIILPITFATIGIYKRVVENSAHPPSKIRATLVQLAIVFVALVGILGLTAYSDSTQNRKIASQDAVSSDLNPHHR